MPGSGLRTSRRAPSCGRAPTLRTSLTGAGVQQDPQCSSQPGKTESWMPGTFCTSRSLQYSPSRCFQCSNQCPGTEYVPRCLTRPSIAPKSTSRAAWWLSAVTMATPACSSSATVSVSVTSRRTDQDSPLLISLSSQEREVSRYGDVWKGDQEGKDPRGQKQGATAEGENKGNSRPWRRPSRGEKIYRQAFNHR